MAPSVTAGDGATAGAARPITIAIVALGGEGGGVLADWLVDLAEHAGWHAQTTSVPGVAQRTGATIYYLEMFPANLPQARGRLPVLAMMPTSGEIDLAIASELMEAGRAVQRGLVTPDRTTLVASTHRIYSMTEKMAMGDGRADSARLIRACQAAARTCVLSDFAALAQASDSVISATLFGAVAATGRLPFAREAFVEAVRRAGVGVRTSLTAFEAGYDCAQRLRLADEGKAGDLPTQAAGARGEPGGEFSAGAPAAGAPAAAAPAPDEMPSHGPALSRVVGEARDMLPAALHATAVHALRRLADYQDVDYASEYLACLRPFAQRLHAGSAGARQLPADWLDELMRHLVLWMTYEDTIRVADLKTRPTRLARVASEVGLLPGQVMEIDEFLHPRVEEIADVLPAALGRRVRRSRMAR
ncbi:MAG TPA: indolepyruvate oxidoreductase subunit beta family protein, partial [Burkholderiaceae bacterium]|nr:indolepyruvate oxidoreductase subunit beta family protein [Burkholderiaceae bacterium]